MAWVVASSAIPSSSSQEFKARPDRSNSLLLAHSFILALRSLNRLRVVSRSVCGVFWDFLIKPCSKNSDAALNCKHYSRNPSARQ